MHSTHLCSHCLRRRMLLWASAFFMTVGAVGAVASGGSAHAAGVQTTPAQVQATTR